MPLTTLPAGEWTFDALAEADLPEDLSRYEVVDGLLVQRPAMTLAHNAVAYQLAVWLDARLPAGWRAQTEVGVALGSDGRRADVGVVRDGVAVRRRQMGHDPSDVALLVEVVSPGSRKADRMFKPAEYAAAGIGAYWRVELEPEPLLVVHRLVGATYEVVQQLTGAGRVEVPFRLEVDLSVVVPPLLD